MSNLNMTGPNASMTSSSGQDNNAKSPYKSEEPIYEQEYRKVLSKKITKQKVEEYKVGKYSKKYIEVYLDFVHLENIITNLEYLEFKNSLKEI